MNEIEVDDEVIKRVVDRYLGNIGNRRNWKEKRSWKI